MESPSPQHRPAGPSTPEDAPPQRERPPQRRVHTVPARLSKSNDSPGVPKLDTVESLFEHSEAKVVSFTVNTATSRPGSASERRASVDATAGQTISWTSPSERTLAAGPLRIYRVPSSGVSFLNSGTLLHPILRSSQCWLVDEESNFVLRVREGSFYRIELPFTTEGDKVAVEEFKRVLGTVLRYERTPSPFTRGYVAEPEAPKTPVRKSNKPREKAKKWRLNKVWEPEDPEHRAKWSPANRPEEDPSSWRRSLRSTRPTTADSGGSGQSQESTTEDEGTVTDSSAADSSLNEEDKEEKSEIPLSTVTPDGSPATPRTFKLALRPRPVQTRAVTAPPPLTVDTTPGLDVLLPLSRISTRESDASSIASRDSFYSADEPNIATENDTMPVALPSLIDQGDDPFKMRANHQRQISEITVTPGTPTPLTARTIDSEDAREPSDPSTPTLIDDSDDDNDPPFLDAVTPPDTLRLRKIPQRRTSGTSYQQALQPCPPPNHFFTAQAPSRRKAISAVLVQKAYTLLVGPPSHLVQLMLDIAGRIVRGLQWEREGRRRVPGAWGSSAMDDDDEDEWDEDDFGIPLDNIRRESAASEHLPILNRSRAASVASDEDDDYDALVEGPIGGYGTSPGARSTLSLD